jgi:hypothetical protein
MSGPAQERPTVLGVASQVWGAQVWPRGGHASVHHIVEKPTNEQNARYFVTRD